MTWHTFWNFVIVLFCFDLLLSQPPSRAGCRCSCYRYHSLVSFRFVSIHFLPPFPPHLKFVWRFTVRQHRLYTCWMTLHLKGLPNRLERKGLYYARVCVRLCKKKYTLHVASRLTSIIIFVNKVCKMQKLSLCFVLRFLLCIGVRLCVWNHFFTKRKHPKKFGTQREREKRRKRRI